jgi:hypothetical protein
MTSLNSLKLITAKRSAQLPVAVQRRQKLLRRLDEQILCARAHAEGGEFTATRKRKVLDSDGNAVVKQVPKQLRVWWWTQESGKIAFSVRYGTAVVPLSSKANAIEVANMTELVSALSVIHSAVAAGDLDTQIVAAGTRLRDGFKK